MEYWVPGGLCTLLLSKGRSNPFSWSRRLSALLQSLQSEHCYQEIMVQVITHCSRSVQFGGTTLTGILLGQTPSWICSSSAFPAFFLVAWWLTLHAWYYGGNFSKAKQVSGILLYRRCWCQGAGHAVTVEVLTKRHSMPFTWVLIASSKSVLVCLLAGTLAHAVAACWRTGSTCWKDENAFTVTEEAGHVCCDNWAATQTLNRGSAVLYFAMHQPVQVS
jgi:hypothetical protein